MNREPLDMVGVLNMAEDMAAIGDFLSGRKGRFVGDALHIDISELATAIRHALAAQEQIDLSAEKKKVAIDGAAAHPQKIMGWNACLNHLAARYPHLFKTGER